MEILVQIIALYFFNFLTRMRFSWKLECVSHGLWNCVT